MWSNDFSKNLLDYEWVQITGPSGQLQYEPFNRTTGERGPNIVMLVSNIAFLYDDEYLCLLNKYAEHPDALERSFLVAWYKLIHQDMGPVLRCLEEDVPVPQPF